EFEELAKQCVFVSATPGDYALKRSAQHVAEQIVRPTGIVDPPIEVRPTKGQVDDLIRECQQRAARNERVLVTTLTKRMSEDLTQFLEDKGLRVKYLHSDIKTIDRTKILQGLRLKTFDVLVGVNLLREGLDLPEVTLVAIFDADKQGFLRSKTSLIQVGGRAARNIHGMVIMYADSLSSAMREAIFECERRRAIQLEFNKKHGITPRTIEKAFQQGIEELQDEEDPEEILRGAVEQDEEGYEFSKYISELEREMELAARNLDFERAAALRDRIKELKGVLDATGH
ncbi:MAG TPA: helicase-related protein, partial [Candidatus Omnitrophota bacterium]|nr:helicase-related protein [Candidatus Omnitrophota bacterium]